MTENYRPAPFFDKLGDGDGAPFYDAVEAAAFPNHILRFRNQRWADKVGLGSLDDVAWLNHFSRFEPLPYNLTKPLAIRYHGHQFRSYNSDIGDGRGFLFAQIIDDQDRLLDLGTKGSGTTPYSRFGDGRLTLKGGVREILATQMLEALGVYTSKSFSLIETGEALERNDEPSPTRSAVLVRLSHSHIRFGVFQRLAFEKNDQAIVSLIDYCAQHFYPELKKLAGAEKIISFYKHIVERTARLAAQWMAAGFVHGVLNTDNMNVTGESFDYGPWRFAPTADPNFTAAYFDQTGLYAFGRQAEACAWSLAQFGGALSLIADTDALTQVLHSFAPAYEQSMVDAFFQRLGIASSGAEDFTFITNLLSWMTETGAPYEQFFFDWFCGSASQGRVNKSPLTEFYNQSKFSDLRVRLLAFKPIHPERLDNAYFQNAYPCTMLIDEVEAIWTMIASEDDWSGFEDKLSKIEDMRKAYGFQASQYLTLQK